MTNATQLGGGRWAAALLPHAILLVIGCSWHAGVEVPGGLYTVVAVAAVLPFWALWICRRRLVHTFLLGPGTAIAAAMVLLVWSWFDPDGGPGGQLGLLVWVAAACAIALYAIYCLIVFAIASWLRKRD